MSFKTPTPERKFQKFFEAFFALHIIALGLWFGITGLTSFITWDASFMLPGVDWLIIRLLELGGAFLSVVYALDNSAE